MKSKGLEIYGWCIMTSHVHMIMGTSGKDLEDIIRDMKKFYFYKNENFVKGKSTGKPKRMDSMDV